MSEFERNAANAGRRGYEVLVGFSDGYVNQWGRYSYDAAGYGDACRKFRQLASFYARVRLERVSGNGARMALEATPAARTVHRAV